jgi:hypothetical protein
MHGIYCSAKKNIVKLGLIEGICSAQNLVLAGILPKRRNVNQHINSSIFDRNIAIIKVFIM